MNLPCPAEVGLESLWLLMCIALWIEGAAPGLDGHEEKDGVLLSTLGCSVDAVLGPAVHIGFRGCVTTGAEGGPERTSDWQK